MTTFCKIDLFAPPKGSRVCVRAKHLLVCYCIRHSLSFDMQHDHILKKLILYKPMSPLQRVHYSFQGHIVNKVDRGLLGDAIYQISSSNPCGFRQEYVFMFPYIKVKKVAKIRN